MKLPIDIHFKNDEYKIVTKEGSNKTLILQMQDEGSTYTSVTSFTAKVFYYDDINSAAYEIDSDSVDTTTGTITFNITGADLAAITSKTAYRSEIVVYDASLNPFAYANGSFIIKQSILNVGVSALVAALSLDWSRFGSYTNTSTHGPYRAGTNTSFSANADGSVDIDVTGGSGDVTAAANLGDNLLIRGDGAAKGVQASGITINDLDSITGVTTLAAQNVQCSTAAVFSSGSTINATGATMISDLDMNSNSILNPVQVDGRDVSVDGTKLDTIETNADVTDAANVTSALNGATITGVTIADISNTVLANGGILECRNTSGSAMSKGDVVYISGYNAGQDLPEIALADANGSGTFPAIGLVYDDAGISNNANGTVITRGRIAGLDTSAFSVSDSVFLSETPGQFSARPTTATSEVQKLGIVLRSNLSNGVIEIVGAGRTNDVPNNYVTDDIGVTIDGAGSAITAGGVYYRPIDFEGTIVGYKIIGDVSGTAVFDVWVAASNAIPTVANTITAAAKPTITAAQIVDSTTLTGWTTDLQIDDVVAFKLDSTATFTWLKLILLTERD